MEAIFFRSLAAEIGPLLKGRRTEKIFSPAPGVWTFKLQATGETLHLLFRPAKSAGHLFLSPVKPDNPTNPPAQVMWFRKHLQGRRLLDFHTDWANLKIAWALTPSRINDFRYVIFDLRNDVTLTTDLPESFAKTVEWPAFEDILANNEIWRQYPHISPPLRKHLHSLPEAEAHAQYLNLAAGMNDQFHFGQDSAHSIPLTWKTGNHDRTYSSALEAANAYGQSALFQQLNTEAGREDNTRLKRERKRLRRNLSRLEQEEERLRSFIQDKIMAEALQAELYRFKQEEGLENVTVSHPEHGEMTVPMNRFLTPTENMERYFRLAAKGERGLRHVKRRRKQLHSELNNLERGRLPEKQTTRETAMPAPTLPKRYRGIAASVFTSTDGFTIIRGRNKKANHDIISKAASAFDYWFHLQDGPSSHVILRRDHPNREIPQTTLEQAAALCALKSYRKEDTKATVMYAQVKDVRKVKGFAHGQVRVDSVIGTIQVDMESSRQLESKLAK